MKSFFQKNLLINQLAGLEPKKLALAIKAMKSCYYSHGSSVADLCKALKVSAPNGVALLSELIDRRIIEKKGVGKSKGGRKPELYGICKDAFHVLSIDMDIYQTRINVFNASNEACSETRTYDIELNNTEETLERLIASIEHFIKEARVDRKLLVGMGVSMPGLVNAHKGVNRTYLKFSDKPLKDILEDRLNLPVFIENDAKAIALSVWRDGVAKGKKDVLVLFLDWGIGLGMILDGKLYRGASGFAGEFSHIPIVENGDLCICGKLGCLQTLGAGTALVKMAKEGLRDGKNSLLANNALGSISLNSIVEAALKGDQFAIHLFSEIGKNLGKGISILIQLFNPEQIVIGGKMAEVGQYLTMPIQQAINTYSMPQISDRVTIDLSIFGKDIGLFGALAVVMSEVFDNIQKHNG